MKKLITIAVIGLALTLSAQAQFTYITNNGTITITAGYTGPGGDVTIPDSINGLPVTTIGNDAFLGCTSLTNVAIGNNVITIGDGAFYACSNLKGVTIPNGVLNIWRLAFSRCSSLTTVAIPKSVWNIGVEVFAECTSLSAIQVDGLNPFYSSVDGVLFNKLQTLLVEYPGGRAGSYAIPSGVTTIGDWAFYVCTNLTNVFPHSLTTIGDYAFYLCTGLP